MWGICHHRSLAILHKDPIITVTNYSSSRNVTFGFCFRSSPFFVKKCVVAIFVALKISKSLMSFVSSGGASWGQLDVYS